MRELGSISRLTEMEESGWIALPWQTGVLEEPTSLADYVTRMKVSAGTFLMACHKPQQPCEIKGKRMFRTLSALGPSLRCCGGHPSHCVHRARGSIRPYGVTGAPVVFQRDNNNYNKAFPFLAPREQAIRARCESTGRVPLFHYTQPSVVPMIFKGGLRMSSQGQGDGGVYFSTLSPCS